MNGLCSLKLTDTCKKNRNFLSIKWTMWLYLEKNPRKLYWFHFLSRKRIKTAMDYSTHFWCHKQNFLVHKDHIDRDNIDNIHVIIMYKTHMDKQIAAADSYLMVAACCVFSKKTNLKTFFRTCTCTGIDVWTLHSPPLPTHTNNSLSKQTMQSPHKSLSTQHT